jgi:hypothetical protein
MSADLDLYHRVWTRTAVSVKPKATASVLEWIFQAQDANRAWARNMLGAFLALLALVLLVLHLA